MIGKGAYNPEAHVLFRGLGVFVGIRVVELEIACCCNVSFFFFV